MKITLRKAALLQTSLQEVINKIELRTSIDLNEYTDATNKYVKAHAQFENSLKKKKQAIGVLYTIRRLISVANAESGINQLLTDIAEQQALISTMSSIPCDNITLPWEEITGRLDKLKSAPLNERSVMHSMPVAVNTSLISQADAAQLKKDMQAARKQKQNLQDRVLELNIRTDIDISNIADFLKEEGLL